MYDLKGPGTRHRRGGVSQHLKEKGVFVSMFVCVYCVGTCACVYVSVHVFVYVYSVGIGTCILLS